MSGIWEVRTDGEGVSCAHPDGARVRLDDATGTASDGYHTFDELYRHRALLTAALFGKLYEDESNHGRIVNVHKARLHSDGTGIEGYFVVMATLFPGGGQISYHCPDADWDLFEIPEQTFADPWDGHTSADVLDRLERYLRGA